MRLAAHAGGLRAARRRSSVKPPRGAVLRVERPAAVLHRPRNIRVRRSVPRGTRTVYGAVIVRTDGWVPGRPRPARLQPQDVPILSCSELTNIQDLADAEGHSVVQTAWFARTNQWVVIKSAKNPEDRRDIMRDAQICTIVRQLAPTRGAPFFVYMEGLLDGAESCPRSPNVLALVTRWARNHGASVSSLLESAVSGTEVDGVLGSAHAVMTVLFQVTAAIAILNGACNTLHNDLHASNILLVQHAPRVFTYRVWTGEGETRLGVEYSFTSSYTPVIFDFGFSVYKPSAPDFDNSPRCLRRGQCNDCPMDIADTYRVFGGIGIPQRVARAFFESPVPIGRWFAYFCFPNRDSPDCKRCAPLNSETRSAAAMLLDTARSPWRTFVNAVPYQPVSVEDVLTDIFVYPDQICELMTMCDADRHYRK